MLLDLFMNLTKILLHLDPFVFFKSGSIRSRSKIRRSCQLQVGTRLNVAIIEICDACLHWSSFLIIFPGFTTIFFVNSIYL